MKSSRFGYKIITTEKTSKKCSSCNKGILMISIVGRYVSFLYIPIMGTRKKSSIYCSYCNKIYKGNQIPNSLKKDSEELKKKSRIPIWFNVGIIVLIIGILFKLWYKFK